MKNNYKKYLYTFFAFLFLLIANAQVVFHETFGTSTTRTTSQYVPQGGNDATLGYSTFTCSSFYKPAVELYTTANTPTCTPDGLNSYNQYVRNISDGYYAVVDPRGKVKSSSPSSLDQLRDWCVTDSNVLGDCGAVLIVNAGLLQNQYYRRGVTLKRNTPYKVSFKVLSSSANLPNAELRFRSKIEVQDVITEEVLGASSLITTSAHNVWETKEYRFRTPDESSCSTNYAISLRNDNAINSGNDFYIDDIILEEIEDTSAPELICNTSTISLIGANDNTFVFELNKTYNILSNDIYIQDNATVPVVVSGGYTNATISPVGTWPSGYSISQTGNLVVGSNASYVQSLQYRITSVQDNTKSSIATIYFNQSVDLAVNLSVTNPLVHTNTSSDHTYTLTIKNVGSQSVTLSSNAVSVSVPMADGATGGFESPFNSNGTQNNWRWTREYQTLEGNYDYTFTYPSSSSVTLTSGQEVIITFSRSYILSTTSPKRSITAVLTYSADGNALNNSSTALVQRVPFPGVIGNSTTVCYGGDYTISNIESGDSSGISSIRYSWEISRDGGSSWNVFGESQEENPTANPVNQSTLQLSNLRESVLVRRKVSEGISTNLRVSYSNVISINVQQQININFPQNINAYYIAEGNNFTIPDFGSINPNLNFEFLNDDGVAYTTNTLTNLSKGEYYITIKATTNNNALLPGCEIYGTLKLIVYDLDDCNTVVKRIYAKKVIPWRSLLGVPPYEHELSVNDDKSQATQLSTVVDVAGLATSGIDLYFVDDNNQLIDIKGKKVTIKLGENYSGLNLAGGTTVTGRWLSNVNTTSYGLDLAGVASSSNYKNVGPTLGVKGGVLDLLRGDNVYEFSFVPTLRSSDNPNQIINGIRIQAGSLLSVANVSQVFHAFIEEEVTVNEYDPCNIGIITVNPPETLNYPLEQKGNIIRNENEVITLNNMAEDATWGNYTEVLNVASGLSSVVYPYYAIDDDYKSYAIFNTTVGVLNKQFLNVRLRQLARPGDQVQITLGTEDINVLNLGLLNLVNHKIKFYLGDALVDEQTLDRFKILDLGLLDFDAGQKLVISKSITVPFDRIQLEQWNTVNANLGNQLYIYDIRTNPQMLFEGQTDPNQVTEVCAADYLKISKMDVCTSFDVQLYYVPENGFGEQLRDELGNLMFDSNGNPILSIISEPLPVPNSEIFFSHSKNNVDYFEVNSLYSQYNGRLLMKIQSERYGCDYGSPQYLRVNLTNCEAGMVNPVINSGVKQ